MEYRYLGNSGFKVPLLSYGAGTFGGKGPLFSPWGQTNVAEARRLIDICLDAYWRGQFAERSPTPYEPYEP